MRHPHATPRATSIPRTANAAFGFVSDRCRVADAGEHAATQGEPAVPDEHQCPKGEAENDQVLEEDEPPVEENEPAAREGEPGENCAGSADQVAQPPDDRRCGQRHAQDHRQAGLDDADADQLERRRLEQAEGEFHQLAGPLVSAPLAELDQVPGVDDVEGLVGEGRLLVARVARRIRGYEDGQQGEQAEPDQDGLDRDATEPAGHRLQRDSAAE